MKKLLFFCLFLCLLACGTAQAASYYVNAGTTEGNVIGDGSAGNPWQTITWAIARSSDNDVIHVAPGRYSSSMSGSSETFPIAFSERQIIASQTHLATIEEDSLGADTILTIGSHGSLEGFYILGDGANYVIETAGSAVTIQNNRIDAANYATVIAIYNTYQNCRVIQNVIWGNYFPYSIGIYIEYDGTYIYRNEVRGFYYGIYEYNWGQFSVTTVECNTVVKNLNGVFSYPDGWTYYRNNIIASKIGGYATSESTIGIYQYGGAHVYSEYNDIYANDDDWYNVSSGEGDFSLDARFVDAVSNDYHLLADSPCIDSGTPEGTERGAYDASGLSVTVTAPNGGEYWQVGTNKQIGWAATGSPLTFKLYYTTSEALNYQLISGEVTGEARSYSWLVPNEPTTKAKVRIEAIGSTVTNESNSFFNIVNDTAPPLITLESLTGGQTVLGNTYNIITWEATDDISVESITLQYSINAGADWINIASQEANDGRYAWLAPNVPTTEAQIKVIATDVVGNTGSDESAGVFTIIRRQDYYVEAGSTEGNVVGDGSAGNPWQTITYATTKVTAGDIVHAAAGRYTAAMSGSVETFPITVPAGVHLLANGVDNSASIEAASGRVLTLNTDSTLEGFTVKSPGPTGVNGAVYLLGKAEVLTNTVTCTATGAICIYVSMEADNSLIKGNRIWVVGNTSASGVMAAGAAADSLNSLTIESNSIVVFGINSFAVYLQRYCQDSKVRNNYLRTGSSGRGVTTLRYNDGLFIDQNTIEADSSGYGVFINQYHNNYMIQHNLIKGADGTGNGIYFNDANYSGNICTNEIRGFDRGIYAQVWDSSYTLNIINNTIVNNTSYGVRCQGNAWGKFRLKNNIISCNPTGLPAGTGVYRPTSSAPDVTSTYDDSWNNLTNWSPGSITGVGTISADPLFYDAANNDFRLSTGSPCIDKGTPEGTDMGCYQYYKIVTVNLRTPNGGEIWQQGIYKNITWEASGPPDSFKLYYSTSEAVGYHLISGEVAGGARSYSWLVTNEVTTQAKIMIEAIGSTVTDESTGFFRIVDDTVPPVTTLESLTGGELVMAGSYADISWEATDDITVESITLQYSINAGADWIGIASNEANDGRFSWLIPNTPTSEARVKVIAVDVAGLQGSAESAGSFTIDADFLAPVVTVEAPDGGEAWYGNAFYNITWQATDERTVAAIVLQYSLDSGASWTTITSEEANDGSYRWRTPNVTTTEAKVKVIAYDGVGNVGSDESDGNFTLTSRRDYYVDAATSEGDVIGAGAPENPWQTITYALSMVSTGDTVHVATGEYNASMVGSHETFPITVEAGVQLLSQASAARAATLEAASGRVLLMKMNTTVEGFSVKTTGPTGSDGAVCLVGQSRILNNYISCGNSDGNAVFLADGADSSLISGNTIWAYNSSAGTYYGIFISTDCDGVTVQNNRIKSFWYGIYSISADYVIIDANTIEADSSYGTGIYNTACDEFKIMNNTIFGGVNGLRAMNCYDGDISSNEVRSFRYGMRIDPIGSPVTTGNIYNNTLIGKNDSVATGDLYGFITEYGGICNIYNNIVCGYGSRLGKATPLFHGIRNYGVTVTSQYNNYWNVIMPHYETYGSITRSNDIARCPRFVNSDASDFRIFSDSPCASAGLGGTYQGRYAPVGASSGIGAEGWVDAIAGSDSAGDGSSGNPWKTLTYAISTTEYTVHVKAGLYDTANGETLPLELAQWQVIRSEADPSIAATIEGTARAITTGQLTTVEGCTLIATAGIEMLGSGRIARNHFYTGTGVTVVNGHSVNLVDYGDTYISDNWFHAASVGITEGAWGPRYSDVSYIQRNTIEVTAASNHYGIYRGQVEVVDNLISGDGLGNGIRESIATTIGTNEIRGFTYGIYDAYDNLNHNTLVNNLYGIHMKSGGTVTAKNNIICGAPRLGAFTVAYGISEESGGTVTSSYNDIWNVNAMYLGGVSASNDISHYPRFVSPEAQDYRICSDSPCASAGEGGTYQGKFPPIGAVSAVTPESWVDPVAGSDSAGDGSAANPWKTLTHALGTTEYTVNAAAGIYDAANGEVLPLGLAQNQHLRSIASPCVTATIDATGSQVVILGQITTLEGFGIISAGGASSYGLVHILGLADVLNNDIRCSAAAANGVYLDRACEGYQIKNNLIAKSPAVDSGSGIFANNCNASGTIRNNEIRGFDYGVNTILRRAVNELEISKNTIVDNQIGVSFWTGTADTLNNIVSNKPDGSTPDTGSRGILRQSGSLNSTYDDCWGSELNWNPSSITGVGTISADPKFVSAAGNDYRLYEGSPCIDSGTPAGTEMGRYDGFVPLGVVTVEVRTPNGGETWQAGNTYDITWEASGSPETFQLYYTTDEAYGYQIITDEVTGTSRQYPWLVPNRPSTSAKVRIEAIKDATTVTDESDGTFTITPPPAGAFLLYISREADTTGSAVRVYWTENVTPDVYVIFGDGSGSYTNEVTGWQSVESSVIAGGFETHYPNKYVLHLSQVKTGSPEAYYKALLPGSAKSLLTTAEAVGKVNYSIGAYPPELELIALPLAPDDLSINSVIGAQFGAGTAQVWCYYEGGGGWGSQGYNGSSWSGSLSDDQMVKNRGYWIKSLTTTEEITFVGRVLASSESVGFNTDELFFFGNSFAGTAAWTASGLNGIFSTGDQVWQWDSGWCSKNYEGGNSWSGTALPGLTFKHGFWIKKHSAADTWIYPPPY
ncbi:MAG: DUF1565 domain-containing protein [Candidatus Margulisbacteria bacterium]|nr:DUF1565 domain-containing protein [Candidatus Margulisiibacteriota bacterium]